MKDLGTAPQQHDSLFDHWHLAFWKRMHEQFGAKIHINIYYQTVARDFAIDRMPDIDENWPADQTDRRPTGLHWAYPPTMERVVAMRFRPGSTAATSTARRLRSGLRTLLTGGPPGGTLCLMQRYTSQ
jgi:hypothetical protein